MSTPLLALPIERASRKVRFGVRSTLDAYIPFLCIDHGYRNGAAERRVLKGHGVYMKLARAGVRLPGYRCLCRNCKFACYYGVCPHQQNRHAEVAKHNPKATENDKATGDGEQDQIQMQCDVSTHQ